MPSLPEWASVALDLAVGAIAGGIGGIAREARLMRSDRELSWLLLPRLVGSCAIGSLALSAATAAGIQNLHALVAVATAAGLLGVAAITDLVRVLVRQKFPNPTDRPKDNP